MKKIVFFAIGLVSMTTFAQDGNVGINEESPQATLEIKVANINENNDKNQGILIPKLTKARVAQIADRNLREGTLVYVEDDNVSLVNANAKVKNIVQNGFYFYSGSYWHSFNDKLTIEIQNSNGGKEYTNPKYTIIKGDFTPSCNKVEDTYIMYRMGEVNLLCVQENNKFQAKLEYLYGFSARTNIDIDTFKLEDKITDHIKYTACIIPVTDDCRNGTHNHLSMTYTFNSSYFIEKIDFTPSTL